MSSSTEQWFVRTSFGALLGPMPEDALDEMARTGALLRTDKLREGSDGIWHPAGDVPGLFDGVCAPSNQPGSRVGDLLPRAMPDGSFVMAKASEIPRSHDDVPLLDEDESSALLSDPTSVSLESVDPLQEAFRRMTEPAKPEVSSANTSRSQRLVKSEMTAQDETDFEVDVPLIPADAAVASVPTEPPPVIEELDFGCSDFVADATPLTEPIVSPPIAPTISRRSVTSRNWSAKRIVWLRNWPAWAVAAGLLIVFAAWWLWPRQRPDIYARYVAIHDELQKRRDAPQDETGLKEFVSRANKELDELLPEVDENASQNQEQRLLLFLGRDCLREMLKQPKEENVRHERLFAAFSGQLQEIYDPSRRTASDANSGGGATPGGSGPTGLRTPHPDSPLGRRGGFSNAAGAAPKSSTNGNAQPSSSAIANPGQSRSTVPTKLPGAARN